ncbi:zinc ribbon domain-containing protein [Methanobrevibacter sp.]|uniref:zinc ribbon domain-containing protein n=1 Tax=Methanobrevibacter sp. TaxID=66852 RepID=UPI00388CFBC4
MVVLRCPYCGEKINQGDEFCSHCGKTIDKPHIDEVDSAFQDIGSIIVKIIGFIILWIIVGLIIGFITHTFNLLPTYSPWLLILTTVLTVVIWILK